MTYLSDPPRSRARSRIAAVPVFAVFLALICASLATPARAQSQGGDASVQPEPGQAFPWEGTYQGTNTGNGNKLTSLTLTGWTARGGLPVEFTLYHNSQGSRNAELGQKWSDSYDISLAVDTLSGNVTLQWGDGQSYTFTKNLDGSYTPPAGIHDALTASGAPISSYDVLTKSQVKYHFTNPGSGWNCVSISDRNNNTLTIQRNTSGLVTSVTDPTNRTLTLGYDANNRINSVTNPLNKQWSLSYNASNELSQITEPAVLVNGLSTNPTLGFGYNASHDITTLTDPRNHSGIRL